MGSNSICIKDMSGILAPYVAFDLVKRLKEVVEVPIQLHSHASTGMASNSYIKAIEAGADVVDCAAAPLSLYTSQPAVETMVASLRDTPYELDLDFEAIRDVSEYFEVVARNRKLMGQEQPLIDVTVISHQIPGGMATNLIAQLEQQNALDRMEEVLEEIPRVRQDMGYPPLVTPTSQLVGTQAVFNVILGERYKIIPREIENYVRGFYGRTPAPISEELKEKALKGEEPIDCRPGDVLEPELPRAKADLDPALVEKEEDYLSYAHLPRYRPEVLPVARQPHDGGDGATEADGAAGTPVLGGPLHGGNGGEYRPDRQPGGQPGLPEHEHHHQPGWRLFRGGPRTGAGTRPGKRPQAHPRQVAHGGHLLPHLLPWLTPVRGSGRRGEGGPDPLHHRSDEALQRDPCAGGRRDQADRARACGGGRVRRDPHGDRTPGRLAVFKRVLIANRGEIALRILRACKKLGLETVGVYSKADEDALHLRYVDRKICVGPPSSGESYLSVRNIMGAAEISGADAVHPGYGFLAENEDFARACEENGIVFIGPSPHAMSLTGNKANAREAMLEAGVPVLPPATPPPAWTSPSP